MGSFLATTFISCFLIVSWLTGCSRPFLMSTPHPSLEEKPLPGTYLYPSTRNPQQKLVDTPTYVAPSLSAATPMSESQRATSIAVLGTQMAEEAGYAQPTPLVAPGYEGPYPTIPVPTVHSDEFLPAPISWRLVWQGHLTIIQVGWIGFKRGGLLIWKPELEGVNVVEIVPLTQEAQGISRLDIVTVCKPFVVIAGRMEQDAAARSIWAYDLAEKAVHLLSRAEAPCWDPSYRHRDPTRLGR